ncbi:hypothetical protein SK128_024116 [Halocaridina rubra]|uniref:Uncharacterized protein n=1 Tax=Halocaridina rubra TaxID=373956 RepID=A0AAN8X2L6_HALRR
MTIKTLMTFLSLVLLMSQIKGQFFEIPHISFPRIRIPETFSIPHENIEMAPINSGFPSENFELPDQSIGTLDEESEDTEHIHVPHAHHGGHDEGDEEDTNSSYSALEITLMIMGGYFGLIICCSLIMISCKKSKMRKQSAPAIPISEEFEHVSVISPPVPVEPSPPYSEIENELYPPSFSEIYNNGEYSRSSTVDTEGGSCSAPESNITPARRLNENHIQRNPRETIQHLLTSRSLSSLFAFKRMENEE